MNYKLIKLLASCAIVGTIGACSHGSDGNNVTPSPSPVSNTEAEQLKIIVSGQVPLLNGQAGTVDAIIYNTTNVAVHNASFSLNGIKNAEITSLNGCDKIIAGNSECRVSLQINAMKGNQSTLSQPLTVSYTNTYGEHKSASMLYNAVRVTSPQDNNIPQLINVSMPNILTDIGNSHVRGVTYVMAQNPANVKYALTNANFTSGAFRVVSSSYEPGNQLNNGALIQIEYDAEKSTALNKNDLQAGKNGGFSSFTLQATLGSPLTLNATSDYVSGGYLITSVMNPLDATSSQSQPLFITNIGTSPVTNVSVTDSMNILNISGVTSTINSSAVNTVTVAAIPSKIGVTSLTVNSSANTNSLPITVYEDPQPLVVVQNTSFLFAATVGQTKSVTLKNMSNQSINITNATITPDSNSGASVAVSGNSCTGNLAAGSTCTISGVTINSNNDEALSSVLVNLAYSYNGGATVVSLTPIGRLMYQSVLRQSVAITAPTNFEVMGDGYSISYESVVLTNTSTSHPVTIESWNMTNNHSSSSWFNINNNGSCNIGTVLQAESANNCTFGITLGSLSISDPSQVINSNESLGVTFITSPLTTNASVASGVVPFQVTIGNHSFIDLTGYTPTNVDSGAGTAASPYNFLGSQAGSSKQVTLNFTNTSGTPITINQVQNQANSFYWAIKSDTCAGATLAESATCTTTYSDTLYQNIAYTTQSGPNVVNNLVLPKFIFTQLSNGWMFEDQALNPDTNDNTVYSNEAILLFDHSSSQQNVDGSVQITTLLVLGTNDNPQNYSFTESANIGANNIIESTGYTMYSTSSCTVTANANGLINQLCTYNNTNPFGVSYLSTTRGSAGSAVGLSTQYYVNPTGNQQAISQKQNYNTIQVK